MPKYNTNYLLELLPGQPVRFVKDKLCPECQSSLVILPPDRVWCINGKCSYGELHLIGDGVANIPSYS